MNKLYTTIHPRASQDVLLSLPIKNVVIIDTIWSNITITNHMWISYVNPGIYVVQKRKMIGRALMWFGYKQKKKERENGTQDCLRENHEHPHFFNKKKTSI